MLIAGIIMAVCGIGLLIFGLVEHNSAMNQFARAFGHTEAFPIVMMVAGIVLAIVGIVLAVKKKKQ